MVNDNYSVFLCLFLITLRQIHDQGNPKKLHCIMYFHMLAIKFIDNPKNNTGSYLLMAYLLMAVISTEASSLDHSKFIFFYC